MLAGGAEGNRTPDLCSAIARIGAAFRSFTRILDGKIGVRKQNYSCRVCNRRRIVNLPVRLQGQERFWPGFWAFEQQKGMFLAQSGRFSRYSCDTLNLCPALLRFALSFEGK